MISKIITSIKFIIYYFINLILIPSKEIVPKSLLVIRLDAIGDYVLFRNFIEVLKESKKYKNHKITLLGNSAWRSLSEELDGEYVDNFIWLERNKFNKDFIYRYKKLKEITACGYEVVLSPAYSREFFYGDAIVKLVCAKDKIGSIGDFSNILKWQKNISDHYYTKLVSATHGLMFEFSRNKEFFENLLEVPIGIAQPNIKLNGKGLEFELPERYAILFIGASSSFRKWNIEGFVKIAEYLKKFYGYEIVLCGGPTDNDDAKEFAKYYQSKFIDLVGKTSLVELLFVINNGDLMIANETSAPHFAVALKMTNIFVIFNGNHYGRFTPYPHEIAPNYHVIYHPVIENNLDDYKKLSNAYGFSSKLNINDIPVKMVINKIKSVLSNDSI